MKAALMATIALALIGFSVSVASPAIATAAAAEPTTTGTTAPEPTATQESSATQEPAAEAQTTLPEVEDEVMCPICGTLLNLSRSPAAERERVYIRNLIAQGKTKDEIKDALVAEYGPQALALPEDKGFNVFAYLVPLLIFIVGGLIVIFAVLSWRRNRDRDDGPDGKSPDSGPKGADSDKLDKDMAEFDY